ncbi:epimerase, partial [bacterium]|nr:epimerase [bacterium]
MKAFSNTHELDEMITRPCDQVREAIRRFPGPITILGAGGKMGFHLCRMLQRTLDELDRKNQLLAVSRFASPDALLPFQQAGIAIQIADLSNQE